MGELLADIVISVCNRLTGIFKIKFGVYEWMQSWSRVSMVWSF